MKPLKKSIKWLAIIVLIIIVLMFTVPFIFKGKLVELAKTEINKNINAKVEFGEFSLSLFTAFPYVNFVVHDFSIIGLEDFETDTLAQFDKLELRVGLFSLGGNQLKINSILIDHPIIQTKVLKNGKANWDIAKESATETTENQTPSTFKLLLERIKINKGTFIYNDESLNFYTELNGFQGVLSGDMVADIASLEIELKASNFTLKYGGIKYVNHASLNIKGGIETDLAKSKYSFREDEIVLNNLGLTLNGSIEMPEEDIFMDLGIVAKQNEFKNFLSMIPAIYNNSFKDLQASGIMKITANVQGIYNEKHMPGFDVNVNINDGTFKYPDLPKSVSNVNLALYVNNKDGIIDHTIIDLKKFHLDFAQNPIDAQLLILNPVSDPEISGMLKGRLDMENLKNTIPLDDAELKGIISSAIDFKGQLSAIEKGKYSNFSAKGEIKARDFSYQSKKLPAPFIINEALLDFEPQYLHLKTFDAQFGKSDFQLNGKIENYLAYIFSDEALTGRFDFNSTLIDLNELMAGTEGESENSQDSSLSVFEVPANIDFSLSSKINKILYDKIEITDLKGNISIKEAKVQMNNVTMNMLDGNISIDGSYETTDVSNPKINFNLAINEFDIQKTARTFNTVKLLAPIAENCSGKFSASIGNYNCLLNKNMTPELKTINANGKISSKGIQLNNSDVFTKISSLLKSNDFKSFAINDLDLSFKVKNGNVEVKPFVTKIKNIKATIGGTQGVDQSINYQIKFSLPNSEFGGADKALNNLLSKAGALGLNLQASDFMNISANITGFVTNPKISLDLGKPGKDAVESVKEQATDKIDKTKQEATLKTQKKASEIMSTADEKAQQIISTANSSAEQIKKSAKSAADKVREEAEIQAQGIEDKASGQLKLVQNVAKKAADKVREEGEKKALKIEEEAAIKAGQVLQKANTEADNIKKKAKEESEQLI